MPSTLIPSPGTSAEGLECHRSRVLGGGHWTWDQWAGDGEWVMRWGWWAVGEQGWVLGQASGCWAGNSG